MNTKNNQFEVCVRAVIVDQEKILVCWNKAKKYYFFPGGHIEYGEAAESALARELKEELEISIGKMSFVGAMENIYEEDDIKRHEINLVFEVRASKINDKSLEDHIDFKFLAKHKFAQKKVFPLALQNSIIRWLEDKKIFWTSQT